MTYANIKMTFYYTDDESKRSMYINLKDGDFKKQIEEFIIVQVQNGEGYYNANGDYVSYGIED